MDNKIVHFILVMATIYLAFGSRWCTFCTESHTHVHIFPQAYEAKLNTDATVEDPSDERVDVAIFDLARQVEVLAEDMPPASYSGQSTSQLAAALGPIVAGIKAVHHLAKSTLNLLLDVHTTAKMAHFKVEFQTRTPQHDPSRNPESEPKSVPQYIMHGLSLEEIGYRRAGVMPNFHSHPNDDPADVKLMREQRDRTYAKYFHLWDNSQGTGITFNKMPDNIKVHMPACMHAHVRMLY